MNRAFRVAILTTSITVTSYFISAQVSAQVAGTTLLGVAYAELRDVATGWSAKRQLLGQAVYNEKNEKVGSVDDLIVSPSKNISYAIIGAGGFLGVAKHDVAIPVSQFTQNDGKFVLAGASKDALKVCPNSNMGRHKRPPRYSSSQPESPETRSGPPDHLDRIGRTPNGFQEFEYHRHSR